MTKTQDKKKEEVNIWDSKWKLINVGRNNINIEVTPKSQGEFEKEIRKHVLSPGFGYEWIEETNEGFIHAGWNVAAKFKRSLTNDRKYGQE